MNIKPYLGANVIYWPAKLGPRPAIITRVFEKGEVGRFGIVKVGGEVLGTTEPQDRDVEAEGLVALSVFLRYEDLENEEYYTAIHMVPIADYWPHNFKHGGKVGSWNWPFVEN